MTFFFFFFFFFAFQFLGGGGQAPWAPPPPGHAPDIYVIGGWASGKYVSNKLNYCHVFDIFFGGGEEEG